ncbi:Gamma-glutamyltranspeptidase 1 [Striga hermonthica]|uniref:Gamma-glutamyltranspeptidase 1 n=1 Tax=Striga hermonthica TaxID=68872 RepID=A0A9N7RG84_STRHE|nr:Gamma-glutamyltranspeptidase 1 [Striga hermonthica]
MFLRASLHLGLSFAVFFLLEFLVSNPKIALARKGQKVVARHGIVATDETECSKIGRDILQRGGHAVDAAVGATLCLGVVSPSFSGLGGGGFMLVRSSNGEAKVFDMREITPGRASKEMFDRDLSKWKTGPLSIAVPGQLAGLYTAYRKYRKLLWESILSWLTRSLTFAPNGELLFPGKLVRMGKLANTLEAIAKWGMNIFYNGSMGEALAKEIQKFGGIITKEDFQKYWVVQRRPLVARVMGYKLVTVPPPASGGAMIFLILNILANYNCKSATSVPMSLAMHRLVQAFKYALAQRMDLGDPAFVNVTCVLKNMTSKRYARKLKNLIDDNKTFDSAHYDSKWSSVHDHGTTHICVVDDKRNVVSMTLSLNTLFGSKLVSPSTGIYLNNQMYDFSIPISTVPPPAPANFIQPFKRPLSSMGPTILLKDGKVKAVIGAAGGLLIPDAVTQVLMNHLKYRMDTFSEVKAARFYHKLNPNVLYLENYTSRFGDYYGYNSSIQAELRQKGHALEGACRWTSCQFVIQMFKGANAGKLVAVSDPRKGMKL